MPYPVVQEPGKLQKIWTIAPGPGDAECSAPEPFCWNVTPQHSKEVLNGHSMASLVEECGYLTNSRPRFWTSPNCLVGHAQICLDVP